MATVNLIIFLAPVSCKLTIYIQHSPLFSNVKIVFKDPFIRRANAILTYRLLKTWDIFPFLSSNFQWTSIKAAMNTLNSTEATRLYYRILSIKIQTSPKICDVSSINCLKLISEVNILHQQHVIFLGVGVVASKLLLRCVHMCVCVCVRAHMYCVCALAHALCVCVCTYCACIMCNNVKLYYFQYY